MSKKLRVLEDDTICRKPTVDELRELGYVKLDIDALDDLRTYIDALEWQGKLPQLVTLIRQVLAIPKEPDE